ncbi:MAG: DUF480 domain-containing protein, partial [Planctomycetales bacterium]|nr:DUF480 domain-containing protein [Planctomycetales bacterium]
NQKSNRDPQMDAKPDDVEDALDELRNCGAVGEVQGGGRVAKYRHYMKEWLGVDGTELAVMAELLLRGSQTVGELRGRAARMASDSLPDLRALEPVLQNLRDKNLIQDLTPAGRGQVVTHNLYLDREWDKVRAPYAGGTAAPSHSQSPHSAPPPSRPAPAVPSQPEVPPRSSSAPANVQAPGALAELQQEVQSLRQEVDRLKKEIEDIWSSIG